MLKKLLAVMAFATLPMIIMGCTSDEENCIDVCEAAKACPNSSNTNADCEASCATLADINAEAGCESEYSDSVSCPSGLDVCEENNDACKDESQAYVGCVLTYCLTNPTAAGCSSS